MVTPAVLLRLVAQVPTISPTRRYFLSQDDHYQGTELDRHSRVNSAESQIAGFVGPRSTDGCSDAKTQEFIGAEKYGCSGRLARNLFTPQMATSQPMTRTPNMERPF